MKDEDLRMVTNPTDGKFTSVDGYVEKMMKRFPHLGVEDVSLILHCLKEKDADKLSPEFFLPENWFIIPPTREELLQFIFSWNYHHEIDREDEPRSIDWRNDLDTILSDYGKENDMFLLPINLTGFHLCSFIFVNNSLKDFFKSKL